MPRKTTALPWVAPQLATLTDDAPEGDDWLHEIKYDGYRLLAQITGDDVRLLTRNQKDWTDRFQSIADALARLKVAPALLDGEVAVEVSGGITSFQALQNALNDSSRGALQFFVFDALFLSGEDLRALPLVERKERLAQVVRRAPAAVRFSDHVVGRGKAFFERACKHRLEGIISKRASAPYRPGRGTDWLKVKCQQEQEFVIGGYTEPGGSRQGFGALHVGAYDDDGRLVYRGKVGTGFTDATLRRLLRRLAPLRRQNSPFALGTPRGAAIRGTHWIEPELVAQIRFTDHGRWPFETSGVSRAARGQACAAGPHGGGAEREESSREEDGSEEGFPEQDRCQSRVEKAFHPEGGGSAAEPLRRQPQPRRSDDEAGSGETVEAGDRHSDCAARRAPEQPEEAALPR